MARNSRNKKVSKTGPEKGLVYLTKRTLISAVKKGTKHVREEAFEAIGYTVIEKNGWVVKEYQDGTIVKVAPIEKIKRPQALILD